MAGLTPTALADFRRLLRARGHSLEQLAADVGTHRTYLSKVLFGYYASPDTWSRIHAVVTPAEWAALCRVEHCPAWNNPAPRLPWCVRVVCGWCGEQQPFKPTPTPCGPGETSHGICPECYRAEMDKLDALRAATVAHLVNTEAGLQVHTSPAGEVPALAAARDFSTPDTDPVVMSCRADL